MVLTLILSDGEVSESVVESLDGLLISLEFICLSVGVAVMMSVSMAVIWLAFSEL